MTGTFTTAAVAPIHMLPTLNLPMLTFRRAPDGSVWLITRDEVGDDGPVVAVNLSEKDARRVEAWLKATRGK